MPLTHAVNLRCSHCGQPVSAGMWRVYSNGGIHLHPWCKGCNRQLGPNPLPRIWAVDAFSTNEQVTDIQVR
jgi:hypothetical protein